MLRSETNDGYEVGDAPHHVPVVSFASGRLPGVDPVSKNGFCDFPSLKMANEPHFAPAAVHSCADRPSRQGRREGSVGKSLFAL